MMMMVVRHLKGGNVLRHAEFKIVGCNVHEQMVFLDRMVGFHLHPFFSFMPLTVIHEEGVVSDLVTGEVKEEKLWLCGHFAGNAFQPLLIDLEAEISKMNNNNNNRGG